MFAIKSMHVFAEKNGFSYDGRTDYQNRLEGMFVENWYRKNNITFRKLYMNKKGYLQMNKLVYLHELDSVRNTAEEIRIGQEAMYHEIVVNGNSVVLTYNQFTDSKAFLCSVKNDVQYKHILELFKKGYIKLSNFILTEYEANESGEITKKEINIYTPSQYYQHALEKNIRKKQKFIFSGMELDESEIELMELMCNALKYSNTSVFDNYEPKSKEEEEKISELIKYIRLLLAISVEELAYNPIKDGEKLTLNGLMSDIINADWKKYILNDTAFTELFLHAIVVLKNVQSELTAEQVNARSNWLKKLYELESNQKVKLAAAIVHLAYNYVVEDSISDVSKHYDGTQAIDALYSDFAHRIVLFWQEHIEEGLHELYNPQNAATGDVWNTILKWEGFPEWETAVRVTDKPGVSMIKKKALYEDEYNQDRKKWRKKLRKTVLLQILIAFAYIILIHIFNEVTGGIQNMVDILVGRLGLNLHSVVLIWGNLVIYTLLLGVFSSYISKKLKLPDILESVDDIANSFEDMKNIRGARKYSSYVWLKEENTDGEK